MISQEDLNSGICFVCKKKLNINSGKNMDKFVYVHFTTEATLITKRTKFLYFCPPCWRETAGEEFCIEGFE